MNALNVPYGIISSLSNHRAFALTLKGKPLKVFPTLHQYIPLLPVF